MSQSTPIFVNGQVVGRVYGDVFRKSVRASVHFLRRPRAIAFDISTLHDALDAGAVRVEVLDKESGRVYVAEIETILRDGTRFNRGYGGQIYLLLDRWRSPHDPRQLSLWGSDPPPGLTPQTTPKKGDAQGAACASQSHKSQKVKGVRHG